MDAEPQAPAGPPPPISTPNAAFNKLATVLTYLAAELRCLQLEVPHSTLPIHRFLKAVSLSYVMYLYTVLRMVAK